jgi:hypothetical protein
VVSTMSLTHIEMGTRIHGWYAFLISNSKYEPFCTFAPMAVYVGFHFHTPSIRHLIELSTTRKQNSNVYFEAQSSRPPKTDTPPMSPLAIATPKPAFFDAMPTTIPITTEKKIPMLELHITDPLFSCWLTNSASREVGDAIKVGFSSTNELDVCNRDGLWKAAVKSADGTRVKTMTS